MHLSDNFDSIPAVETFDLVVGNPPWYYADNSAHRLLGSTRLARTLHQGRLCAIDAGWKIHERFYANVVDHLNPGALVCPYVQAPFDAQLWFSPPRWRGTIVEPKPYNVRPEPPLETFRRMIASCGLEYVATVDDAPLRSRFSFLRPFPPMWIVISRKPGVPPPRAG